jgi:hypothetical protein
LSSGTGSTSSTRMPTRSGWRASFPMPGSSVPAPSPSCG